MREIMNEVGSWLEGDESIALATVIQTWGSSPRSEGAKMAMTRSGKIVGSVSGGCVEGAVFETGMEVLKSGHPQLLHFGVADETAWQVGLACGGIIEIFVQPLDRPIFDTLRDHSKLGKSLAEVTIIRGSEDLLGEAFILSRNGLVYGRQDSELGGEILNAAQRALNEKRSQRYLIPSQQEPSELFIEVILPFPKVVMVGGVHIAVALTSIAKTLGYSTVIIDPRKAFGSQDRFSHADRLIQAWPDDAFSQVEINEETAIAMLTHDPKIDDPALKIALRSPAFYIGALGSRTTQVKRHKRLLEAGFSEADLTRLHGPIGLDIGAQNPEEIALAIMGEIIAARHGEKIQSKPILAGAN
jgi:xanthine dehydrogenase accessory factor